MMKRFKRLPLLLFCFCFAITVGAQSAGTVGDSSADDGTSSAANGISSPGEGNAGAAADNEEHARRTQPDLPERGQEEESLQRTESAELPDSAALEESDSDSKQGAAQGDTSSEGTDAEDDDLFHTTEAYPPQNGLQDRDVAVKDTGIRARISRRFEGGVTAIADSAATRSFFAAGKDGFITCYTYGTLQPETWQVSVMPIKRIAVHPKKAYIAVYETDGFSVHKISLWDWPAKKQLYAKRFTNSVLSLSWSAQGTYLFIGTASTEGIIVLDAKGNVKKVYPRPPGIVLLAATGPSEKSIVTYGETGRLVYADIGKRSILTQYDTEDRLESPELIKNYTNIIGYKNGNVIAIKAASGELLQSYPARSALFAGKITDSLPVWIEKGETSKSWHLCQGTKKSPAFSLPHHAAVTAARHVDAAIVIGTDDGRLYRLRQGTDAAITLTELNDDFSVSIRDICSENSRVYMLSGTTLYMSRSPAEQPEAYIRGITADRCTAYGSGFLFWSDGKTAPLYYAEEGKTPTVLYRPREPLNSVSVYKDVIAAVQTFSGLTLLDGKTGKKLFTYGAAGLQDAVQVDDTFVLLTKSTGGVIRQPLLLINIKTGETIPLGLDGDLAFSLRANEQVPNAFSCFRLKTEDTAQTDLVTMKIDAAYPARSSFITALSYKDEDLQASLYDGGAAMLTNLGKSLLVYYDKNRRTARQLPRDYALSRKALMTDLYIVSLNYDGSLSWFRRQNLQLLRHQPLKE